MRKQYFHASGTGENPRKIDEREETIRAVNNKLTSQLSL